MALLLLIAWIYYFISKSPQKQDPHEPHDFTMSDSPRTESQPSTSGSPISSASWTTPDRNNNSVSSMEEGEDGPVTPVAIHLLVSPAFSPFDFRNTRTPEEMALFDRFGDGYQEVVNAMDLEEQHHLKGAIKFEVPNHPTVSANGLHLEGANDLSCVHISLGASTEARTCGG